MKLKILILLGLLALIVNGVIIDKVAETPNKECSLSEDEEDPSIFSKVKNWATGKKEDPYKGASKSMRRIMKFGDYILDEFDSFVGKHKDDSVIGEAQDYIHDFWKDFKYRFGKTDLKLRTTLKEGGKLKDDLVDKAKGTLKDSINGGKLEDGIDRIKDSLKDGAEDLSDEIERRARKGEKYIKDQAKDKLNKKQYKKAVGVFGEMTDYVNDQWEDFKDLLHGKAKEGEKMVEKGKKVLKDEVNEDSLKSMTHRIKHRVKQTMQEEANELMDKKDDLEDETRGILSGAKAYFNEKWDSLVDSYDDLTGHKRRWRPVNKAKQELFERMTDVYESARKQLKSEEEIKKSVFDSARDFFTEKISQVKESLTPEKEEVSTWQKVKNSFHQEEKPETLKDQIKNKANEMKEDLKDMAKDKLKEKIGLKKDSDSSDSSDEEDDEGMIKKAWHRVKETFVHEEEEEEKEPTLKERVKEGIKDKISEKMQEKLGLISSSSSSEEEDEGMIKKAWHKVTDTFTHTEEEKKPEKKEDLSLTDRIKEGVKEQISEEMQKKLGLISSSSSSEEEEEGMVKKAWHKVTDTFTHKEEEEKKPELSLTDRIKEGVKEQISEEMKKKLGLISSSSSSSEEEEEGMVKKAWHKVTDTFSHKEEEEKKPEELSMKDRIKQEIKDRLSDEIQEKLGLKSSSSEEEDEGMIKKAWHKVTDTFTHEEQKEEQSLKDRIYEGLKDKLSDEIKEKLGLKPEEKPQEEGMIKKAWHKVQDTFHHEEPVKKEATFTEKIMDSVDGMKDSVMDSLHLKEQPKVEEDDGMLKNAWKKVKGSFVNEKEEEKPKDLKQRIREYISDKVDEYTDSFKDSFNQEVKEKLHIKETEQNDKTLMDNARKVYKEIKEDIFGAGEKEKTPETVSKKAGNPQDILKETPKEGQKRIDDKLDHKDDSILDKASDFIGDSISNLKNNLLGRDGQPVKDNKDFESKDEQVDDKKKKDMMKGKSYKVSGMNERIKDDDEGDSEGILEHAKEFIHEAWDSVFGSEDHHKREKVLKEEVVIPHIPPNDMKEEIDNTFGDAKRYMKNKINDINKDLNEKMGRNQ